MMIRTVQENWTLRYRITDALSFDKLDESNKELPAAENRRQFAFKSKTFILGMLP